MSSLESQRDASRREMIGSEAVGWRGSSKECLLLCARARNYRQGSARRAAFCFKEIKFNDVSKPKITFMETVRTEEHISECHFYARTGQARSYGRTPGHI